MRPRRDDSVAVPRTSLKRISREGQRIIVSCGRSRSKDILDIVADDPDGYALPETGDIARSAIEF